MSPPCVHCRLPLASSATPLRNVSVGAVPRCGRPRAALELGTASGAFSNWLNERVEWFRTIDIDTPAAATPGFMQLDVWAKPDAVRELVAQAPRPFVLYCDNGNKVREVETFAPSLNVGDFLAVHDFGTEILPRHIPPTFDECLTLGLTSFY